MPGPGTGPRPGGQETLLYRDLGKHNSTKLSLVGRSSSMLQDSVKCTVHIKSKMKLDTFVNSTLSSSQRI